MPSLSQLLLSSEEGGSILSHYSLTGGRHDLKQVAYVFGSFLQALCTQERPLLLFLDDLQWADSASLELLAAIFSKMPIEYLFFVGSYRSNEVDENHFLRKYISDLENKRAIQQIPLSNLSPHHIGAFIAETLDMAMEEVAQVTEIIYSKTIGNIFFCRQAMEELVRMHAIYYDVMVFQWQFNLGGVDLTSALSDDVVKMVQSKLECLHPKVKRTLIIAAYIRHIIDFTTLLESLKTVYGYDQMDANELKNILDRAVSEGLLLKISADYRFSQSKVGWRRLQSGGSASPVVTFWHSRRLANNYLPIRTHVSNRRLRIRNGRRGTAFGSSYDPYCTVVSEAYKVLE
jgi:predicted ATPase